MSVLALIGEITEGPAHPNLWNPTILGVLVVLSAIGLFCGSAYLLLATNLGGRLGFLVHVRVAHRLPRVAHHPVVDVGQQRHRPPHGRSPSWKVVDVVSSPAASKIAAVREAPTKGTPANETQIGNLRPAMDATLVHTAPIEGVTPPSQPFANFEASLGYLTDFKGYQTFIIGGGTKNLLWHNPKYAVAAVLSHRSQHADRPASRVRPAAAEAVRRAGLQLRLAA